MKRLVWSLMLVALSMAPALQAQGPPLPSDVREQDDIGFCRQPRRSIPHDRNQVRTVLS